MRLSMVAAAVSARNNVQDIQRDLFPNIFFIKKGETTENIKGF
jgi:hypothetical protein